MVLRTTSGSRVLAICAQTSVLIDNQDKDKTSSGIKTTKASIKLADCQPRFIPPGKIVVLLVVLLERVLLLFKLTIKNRVPVKQEPS